MGYDIAFHAISQRELEHYVFDVLRDPSLAAPRAAEITPDPEKQDRIKTSIYQGALINWFENEKDGDGDPITDQCNSDFDNFRAHFLDKAEQ